MNYTIKKSISSIYKEKRSEFIGYSKPIKNVEDHHAYLKELKSKYPSARHICWAHRIAIDDGIIENSTDAGEPSGSAGIPILNVLKKNDIVNCGIFIVRFFGGVKLGKQGLTNAYKTTTELVIAKSVLHKWLPKAQYFIDAPVIYFGKVANIIERNNGIILINQTTSKLNLLIELPLDNLHNFKMEFDDVTQNSGEIKKQSERDQTKEVRK